MTEKQLTQIYDLNQMPARVRGNFESKVVTGRGLMSIWVTVAAGTHTAAHQHPNEQVTWLRSGHMRYRVGNGELVDCGPGSVVHIPGGIEHEVWYVETCEYVEVFSPPRWDLYPSLKPVPPEAV
jgi:quercetin dioxygenase-like cupin family protein